MRKKIKRILSVILVSALLLAGPIAAQAASIVSVNGSTPAYAQRFASANALAFAKSTKLPTQHGNETKLGQDLSYDMMIALLPLLVCKYHYRSITDKKSAAAMQKEYAAAADKLFAQYNWGGETTLAGLTRKGRINTYAARLTEAYTKAAAKHLSAQDNQNLVFQQWWFRMVLMTDVAVYWLVTF